MEAYISFCKYTVNKILTNILYTHLRSTALLIGVTFGTLYTSGFLSAPVPSVTLRCDALRCVALCCVVLCCVVLCYVMLCCVVWY
jgi:hypothetical protein